MLRTCFIWVFFATTVAFCVEHPPSSALVVSNFQELITEPVYFSPRIVTQNRGRFLYYHKLAASIPLTYCVWITNLSPYPVPIWVFSSQSGPDPDGLHTGHMVTQSWWQWYINPHSKKRMLLPHQPLLLISHPLKNGQVSSGILEWKVPTGTAVQIYAGAIDARYPQLSLGNMPKKSYQLGLFSSAETEQHVTLDTRILAQEIPVGGPPFLKDSVSGIELRGNYAQIQTFYFNLQNPNPRSKWIRLWMAPAGGIARGQIVIDGHWMETGFFQKENNFEPIRLHEWKLEPYETKTVKVQTTPQPGSYYPVNLVLQQEYF